MKSANVPLVSLINRFTVNPHSIRINPFGLYEIVHYFRYAAEPNRKFRVNIPAAHTNWKNIYIESSMLF